MFKNKRRLIVNIIIILISIVWLCLIKYLMQDAINLNIFLNEITDSKLDIINISKNNTDALNYYLILINVLVYILALIGAMDGYYIKNNIIKNINYFKLNKKKNNFFKKELILDLLEQILYTLILASILITLTITLNIDIEIFDLISISIYMLLITLSFYSFTIFLSYIIKIKQVAYISVLIFLILRIIFNSININTLTYLNPFTMINIGKTLTNNTFLLSEVITNISFIIIFLLISKYIEGGIDD